MLHLLLLSAAPDVYVLFDLIQNIHSLSCLHSSSFTRLLSSISLYISVGIVRSKEPKPSKWQRSEHSTKKRTNDEWWEWRPMHHSSKENVNSSDFVSSQSVRVTVSSQSVQSRGIVSSVTILWQYFVWNEEDCVRCVRVSAAADSSQWLKCAVLVGLKSRSSTQLRCLLVFIIINLIIIVWVVTSLSHVSEYWCRWSLRIKPHWVHW